MKRKVMWWLIGLAGSLVPIGIALLGVVLMMGVISANQESADDRAAGGGTCRVNPDALTVAEVAGFTRSSTPGGNDDQLYNAAVIMAVGSGMGLSQRDQQIALMTAMQESGLRNINYGDWETSGWTNPDGTPTSSLGLFQQQKWWGTTEQRLNPYESARLFYEALQRITDRDSLSLSAAAQAVQVSAYPEAYAKHESAATAIIQAIYTDAGAVNCSITAGGMTLEQAQTFMDIYRAADADEWDVNSCGCVGGCLANCVSFSIYFVNRYTHSHVTGATGNGRDVADYMINRLGFIDGGHVPKPFAIFSMTTGVSMCDGSLCGHTGVVLGIDEANDLIIIGEAACSDPGFTGAHVYLLSEWSTSDYTYAYTDTVLKGDPSV